MSSTNSTNLNPVIRLNPTTVANINSAQAQRLREQNQRRSITAQNQIQNNAVTDVSTGTYVGSSSNTDNTSLQLAPNRNNVSTNLTASSDVNNATLTNQNTTALDQTTYVPTSVTATTPTTTTLTDSLSNGMSQVLTNTFSPILQQLSIIFSLFICSPLCMILIVLIIIMAFRK